MNVQGNKISLRHFVCNVLPEVYKKVSEKDTTKALASNKQKRRLTTHMELKNTGTITEIRLKAI